MKNKKRNIFAKSAKVLGIAILFVCLGLSFMSCASKPDLYAEIDLALEEEDYRAAIDAMLAAEHEAKTPFYGTRNQVSFQLNLGMLHHYDGDSQTSSNELQLAERLIEEAYTKSVTDDILSYIANDNTKEYAGEDFEDIYLNIFNALNYQREGNIEGAMVEIRKLTESSGKLTMLRDRHENASAGMADKAMSALADIGFTLPGELPQEKGFGFSNSALARYISALFYLGDGNTDGARIEFEQLRAAFASNPEIYSNSIPSSVSTATAIPAGKARLNVIGFSGLSPHKVEEHYTQDWTILFPRYLMLQAPTFKLPVMTERPSHINRVQVIVEGQEPFELELLEDMGAVVTATFDAKFSSLFFKTYMRVLLKYAAANIAMMVAEDQGLPNLAVQLAGIPIVAGLDATEGADVRMSRFLPNKALVGSIDLDPGTYNVEVNFLGAAGVVATRHYTDVEVNARGLNLISAFSLK